MITNNTQTYHKHYADLTSERGSIDLRIRHEIYKEEDKTIYVPDMPDDKLNFWKWLAWVQNRDLEFIRVTSKKFPDYPFTKPALVAFSGGLESVFTAKTVFNGDIFCLDGVPDSERQIEGLLAIHGADLGYACTYIGCENDGLDNDDFDLEPTTQYSKDTMIECTFDFIQRWNNYAYPNVVQSAVRYLNKIDILKKIIDTTGGLTFHSCFNTTPDVPWCGKCFKCMIIFHFLMVLEEYDLSKEIPLTKETHEKYCEEYRQYLKDGKDPFFTLKDWDFLRDRFGYDILKVRLGGKCV